MIKSFVKQIPYNSKISIFGAGFAGRGLRKYIEENRPDIKIVFFIESHRTGDENGIPIVNFKDLPENKNKFDLLVCATRNTAHELIGVFNYLDIPFIIISREIEQYFRNEKYAEILEKTEKCFKYEEDKELYKLIGKAHLTKIFNSVAEYALKKHDIAPGRLFRNYDKHYMEFINKDAIQTVFDGGFHNGIHSLAFKKHLKNLKVLYAFEPMYDKFKNEIYDKFIRDAHFCEFVELGLWEKESELVFAENLSNPAASKVVENSEQTALNMNYLKIKTIDIDTFKKKNNIQKVDFIKMDIEGAELPAIRGAKETIKTDRPQLAISIYHSNDDFVNIPQYLANELENYTLRLGHYSYNHCETVLYAIPDELLQGV